MNKKNKVTDKQSKKKITKKPQKNKGGRPSVYKKAYCEDIIKFFSVDHTKKKKVKKFYKGVAYDAEIEVSNKLPLFEDYAYKLRVDTDTLLNWTKKHTEFFGAYKRAKELQKSMLVDLSLKGLVNTPYSIFLSKNITDLRDRIDTDITSGGQPVESVNLNSVIKELKKLPTNELQKVA